MTATASGEPAPARVPERRLRLTPRRDWLFLGLLLAAVVVRVLVTVTYRPGLELYGDSYDYLGNAQHLHQGQFHPLGYPVFLRALWWTHYTLAVVTVQHLLGLAAGVATYLAVRRLSTRPWLAALAAAPVLLDAYQVYVEQFLLSDTLFLVLVLAACLAVLVPERPGLIACAAAGVLLAAATLTRGLGLVVLLPLAAYLLLRRPRLRRLAVVGACAVLPVAAYMVRFHQTTGSYSLEQVDGVWLYGRTAYFASCRSLPASVRDICPNVPPAERESQVFYTWSAWSPLYQHYQSLADRDRKGRQFGIAVIKADPVGYLRTTVVDGLLRDAAPVRADNRWASRVQVWQMSRRLPARRTNTMFAASTLAGSEHVPTQFPDSLPVHGPGGFLAGYRTVVYAWGPTLVLAALLATLAVVLPRSRGDRRAWVAVTLAAAGVLLLLVPALTNVQSYRYVLPAQALLWPAGALALEAVLSPVARGAAGRTVRLPSDRPAPSGRSGARSRSR